MIVDGKNRDETEQKLVALRNSLSSFIAEICGGYIDMGVSRIFEQETGFRRAYNESLEALKINEYSNRDENIEGISMEDSSVTYYGDLIGHSPGGSDYNLVLDAAIKEAIDSGDQKRAFAITNEFMKEVNKSGVVLYEQHYYFHRFLLAILSVPADAGIPIYDLFPEGDEDLFLQFNQLYDSRSIKMFYETKVIVPVINRMNQFRKSSSEMVMDKITELVEKNGGDLTLSECAEKVGCHPSYIWRVMKNTKDMTFTDYVAGQKLEMAKRMLVETDLSVAEIAERLSYSKFMKKSIQTMIYIPHFISMVIVASITFTLLNTDSGVINQIIYSLTGNKLEFLSDPKYFRWIIVIQNIWKETGWGMIIFLAALAGVDTQLYEAAQVDGAGKLRQVWHVTLPAIKSTIIIMLIMKVGTLLNTGFEQIFLMKNSLNSSVAEVFDTYVYTLGITQGAFSYSTAVGMFKSVVATVMVLTTNWICKKCGETGLY